MVKTASAMILLGTAAPDFSLVDVVTEKMINLYRTPQAKATVVMFICNHCPYVKHINQELTALAHTYLGQGVNFFAISSNDSHAYPEDSPVNMLKTAQACGYPFPYLFDETQEVARAYQAACTPDFYVFDSELYLAYRGQLDDSRPGNKLPVTGDSIRYALDCLVKGEAIVGEQKPSLGCNIKWKN